MKPRAFFWMNPKLEASECRLGKGVVARKHVKQGEKLAICGGYIMRLEDEMTGDHTLQIDEEFVIGATRSGQLCDADYFNHSCDPNAGFKGQILLVAMREITTGEEVSFDYAMCLYGPPYRMECRCGAKNCRGVITEDDWRRLDLQARYDGYFQWFLQEKINKLRLRKL